MSKKIKDYLVKYAIYVLILFLLFDNKSIFLQLKHNSFVICLLAVFFICLIANFIATKQKIYYVKCFLKNYFSIIFIAIIFLFYDCIITKEFFYKQPDINFFINSFIVIVVFDFITALLLKDEDFCYMCCEFSDVILEIFKDIENSLFKKNHKLKKEQIIIETDKEIKDKTEDKLGRMHFIESIKNIFENDLDRNIGDVILFSANWGEGKSSCINLLENELNKNEYEFIRINPWFNDTKEKLLNALFGELNDFSKTHFPYKSLQSEFKDITKLSNIKVPNLPLEIDLNKFNKDKNIQNKINEIGNILKIYKKQIFIIFDDLDRLTKNNILYILQIVQMFREYTNLNFILSCDYDKVQQILCETSEPCFQNESSKKEIQKTSYYKNYIEKICTYQIFVPKIMEQNIILSELFNKIGKYISIIKNKKNNLFLDRFKNLRDVKRFNNTFYTVWLQAKEHTEFALLFNIVILECFYNSVYNIVLKDIYNWFYWAPQKYFSSKTYRYETESSDKFSDKVNNYFDNFMKEYDIDKELIYLISPVYYKVQKANMFKENSVYVSKKEPDTSNKSYFYDINYLPAYFTFNYSLYNIFDNEMKNFYQDNKYKLIKTFLINYKSNTIDLFKYILNSYIFKDNYIRIYIRIIECFVLNSLKFFDKSKEYIDYYVISILIKEIFEYMNLRLVATSQENKISVLDKYIKLIKRTTSPILSILLIYTAYKNINKEYFNDIFLHFIHRTEQNMELFLKLLYINNNIYISNMCILAYLFEEENFKAYFSSDEKLKITKNNFVTLKERVKKIIPHFKNNNNLFSFFVLDTFNLNVEDFLGKIPSIDVRSIVFQVHIWGLDNIEYGIRESKKSSIYLFEQLLNNKKFIVELFYEYIITDSNKNYTLYNDKYIVDGNEKDLLKILICEYISSKEIDDFCKSTNHYSNYKEILNNISYTLNKKNKEFKIYFICDNENDKNKLEQYKDKFIYELRTFYARFVTYLQINIDIDKLI